MRPLRRALVGVLGILAVVVGGVPLSEWWTQSPTAMSTRTHLRRARAFIASRPPFAGAVPRLWATADASKHAFFATAHVAEPLPVVAAGGAVGETTTSPSAGLSSGRSSTRRQTQKRPPAATPGVLLAQTWRDRSGACELRLRRDALFIRLRGFGTARTSVGAIDELDRRFVAHALDRHVTTLVDMRRASACHPAGIRRCIRFVRDHGSALDHVAIVSQGLPLQYVRVVLFATKLDNVRVFPTFEGANRWIEDLEAQGQQPLHGGQKKTTTRRSPVAPQTAMIPPPETTRRLLGGLFSSRQPLRPRRRRGDDRSTRPDNLS